MKNFYPNQYKNDKKHLINHNYLTEQFSDVDEILKKIRNNFSIARTLALLDKTKEKEYIIKIISIKTNLPVIVIAFKKGSTNF